MITHTTRWLAGCFMLMVALLPVMAQADTGRVALIIGNGDYDDSIGALRNPANDAKLMAQTLKKLGFTVTLAINVDQKEMKRSIRDFGAALTTLGPEGIGLFYYAGHGVQVDGVNYLLPIGAEIRNEGDVELEAIAANSVLAQMQYAQNNVNLVFLDACRNNPLTRGFRSASRGLARVDAPRGSFVGYSTAPGEVSVDGNGNNSPYTLALADELLRPGQAIEEVHRAVRLKVLAATNDQQTPWDSSSLTATVTLSAPIAKPVQAAAAPAPAAAPVIGTTDAERVWADVQNSKNPAVFRAFLQQYPNGIYAALAQEKLDQLSGAASTTEQATPAPAEPPQTQAPAAIVAAVDPAPAPVLNEGPAIVPMTGAYIAKKNANIRATPDAKGKLVGKLKAQESVTVTGRTEDAAWLQIASGAGSGFVSAELLKLDPTIAVRTPAPEPAPAPVAAPTPKANALRLSEVLRPEIEKYLANSQKQSGNYRFLAVNGAGDKLGLSIGCKVKKSGWGGWTAEGCGEEKDARRLAVETCGSDCRVIFNGAEKVGDFEIEWVKADGSSEAATLAATDAVSSEAPAADAPVVTARAADMAIDESGDSVLRVAETLRAEIEKYLANSQKQTGNYRFLAINPAGDKLGLSIGCKMKKSGWGGWTAEGCGEEKDAMRLAIEACGSDCRVIFKGAEKIGSFRIEWQ